jgi:ubiquinol-cytochrome c reductase iron-sulfur subunit
MAGHVDMVDVVHRGAAHASIVPAKSQRFDQIDSDAKAGAKPHYGTDILCDFRFEEGNPHGEADADKASDVQVRAIRPLALAERAAISAPTLSGLVSGGKSYPSLPGRVEHRRAKRVSMVTPENMDGGPEGGDGVRRRDFINIAAVSFAGVGAAAVAGPLLTQMSPSADVLAMASTEVDISKIEPGQGIKTIWRKQPIFVRNLMPKEIQEAKSVPMGELRDPQSLEDRTKPGKENWLVTLGVCTHLGCVPLGISEGENKGEYGGYFCPCHGSHYDTAARIRKGPAPTNLVVPEYEFSSDTVVKIG